MNNQLSFKELKDRVSIMQVAMDLGYVLDKSKGNSQPSFVLMSGGKEETDRIYIKNPNNPSIQGYWRRGSYSKGDVISFVDDVCRVNFAPLMRKKNQTFTIEFTLMF